MTRPRHVDGDLLWRVARNTMARMACAENDPTGSHPGHAECQRDDESYAADLLLRLIAAVASGDDDRILGRLEDVRAAIAVGD